MKKELSIFVDESGDFGDYQSYCPFYIVSFVFHDQQIDISDNLKRFNSSFAYLNLPNNYIHAGPIIRQEDEYYSIDIKNRRKAINIVINFIRTSPIHYHTFIVNRLNSKDELAITTELSKQIKDFISSNLNFFIKYSTIKVYYDNGQKQLAKILASVLPITIPHQVLFRKINPPESYRFFQATDAICTLELINEKIKKGIFSKSEKIFFKTKSQFKSDYYKKIEKKKI